MRARLVLAMMPDADRAALLREAEEPWTLPEGEGVAPELQSLEALARSPMAALLDELFAAGRDTTPEDHPVPIERWVFVLRTAGLADQQSELVPHLRQMDRVWRETLAQERERRAREERER